MKSIKECIDEARLSNGSLKWGDKEWAVIEKIIAHVNDNPEHAAWYKKMSKESKQYKYDVFAEGSPLLNNLDSWKRIKENGKFGYWTPDGCSEFTNPMVESIYFVLASESYFHHEDPKKDKYTEEDIKTIDDMIDNIMDVRPTGKLLTTREEVLKIVEPIVSKYKSCKIEPEEDGWSAVVIQADDTDEWLKCEKDVDNALKSYKNIVTGDGMFNSIYIDYED